MDEITLQLNSPITEDQWDAITDVDFENTKEILFTTKHKKNVRFVKAQQWIPCSERMPERNGYYLVTGRQGAVNKRLYQDGYWYGNWAIIAWMPLPEPYRGESDV